MSNKPWLNFKWWDVFFGTSRFRGFIKRHEELLSDKEELEGSVHRMKARIVDDNRLIDTLSNNLAMARNHIAELTGAADSSNLPYTVKGAHAQSKPQSAPRPETRVPTSTVRPAPQYYADHHERSGAIPSTPQDNSVPLAVLAYAVLSDSDNARATPEPQQATACAPAYVAPEPQRESYSPPSRSESYDSPSSGDSSPPSCD